MTEYVETQLVDFTSRTLGCIKNTLLDLRDKVLSERYYTMNLERNKCPVNLNTNLTSNRATRVALLTVHNQHEQQYIEIFIAGKIF